MGAVKKLEKYSWRCLYFYLGQRRISHGFRFRTRWIWPNYATEAPIGRLLDVNRRIPRSLHRVYAVSILNNCPNNNNHHHLCVPMIKKIHGRFIFLGQRTRVDKQIEHIEAILTVLRGFPSSTDSVIMWKVVWERKIVSI